MFTITRPRDLTGLLRAALPDAAAEVTIFGVAPGPDRLTALTRSLRGPARPTLAGILRPGDVFTDLTIGADPGYHDSVTIASRAGPHRTAPPPGR